MKKLLSLLAFAGIISACNMPNNNSMNSKAAKNEAGVQKFYDQVINAHNSNAVDSFCTAEFVDHQPEKGHSGKGIDDLKAQFKDWFTSMPDVHIKTDYMISNGDTVIAKIVLTGTNTGPMGPMPATNKAINIEGVDILVIKDGKATDRWGYFEDMKMMEQLGMMGDHSMDNAQKMDDKGAKK